MTGALERLTGAGAGPGRLRATLRRDTAAVREIAASYHGVSRLGYHLPETLLGGELANLMGESLRRALRFWEHDAPVPARPSSQGPRPFAPHDATPEWRAGLAALESKRPAPARPFVSDPLETDRRHAQSVPATGVLQRAAHAREPSVEIASRRPAAMLDTLDASAAARASSASASIDIAGRSPAAGQASGSPLVRVLRAYWRGQQVETRAGAGSTPASPITPRDVTRLAGPGQGGAPSRHATADGDIGAVRDVPRRESADPVVRVRPRASTVLRDRAADIDPSPAREAWPTGRMATDWLTGDLADQLADVLREQAIREGVDLT